ncbi:hypothetical protein N0V95_002699 [Ascochyta clinopodiicola]|nr:hypothetical protein N0V95_002699 [Ascochyta clinopodiicola]
MRIWLQKQKKKEEAKAAAQAATPVPETTPAATEAPSEAGGADKPIDSVEEALATDDTSAEPAMAATDAEEGEKRTISASAQPNEVGWHPLSFPTHSYVYDLYKNKEKTAWKLEGLNSMNTIDLARAGGCSMHILPCALADLEQDSTALDNDDQERRSSLISQNATQSVEPSAANATSGEQTTAKGPAGMTGNHSTMNGMQGPMGFGFQGQGNFGGMGFNGMSNMMGNASWNSTNSMDYNMNNSNGMYGNFGGNMGMGMTDMSAMNMMNYGGGYGNGWNGMSGGYGNFNGFNQMGGYNQSGAYPEMMSQFPKNNFQSQNQNRFSANQGGVLPQRNNRTGSQGGSVSGVGGQQNASSRPGSRSGPAQNREGESLDASKDAAAEPRPDDEQDTAIKSTEDDNENEDGVQDAAPTNSAYGEVGSVTESANDTTATANGLNQIQTVDIEDEGYDQSMMGNGMQPNMGYANGMMNQFPNQMQMNAPFDPSMNMGFHQNNNFGPRGGFNAAYGAATVLTGEPQGRGVEGAPTGPRAMREGRPNTGFSSRMNNVRYQPPPKSVTPAQSTGGRSPQRRVRSRSPQRDESLRTKNKSVSRSRSRSRARDEGTEDHQERSRSADRESKLEGRGRSSTPQADEDYEHRKDRRPHRSSRLDDREEHRDDRGSRGDRTRSASADSKYRSSRRDKDKYRSSRSHRDRSKEPRRRHRSRSLAEGSKYDDEAYANGERDSESGSRRKHRSDKDKHRDRSRDKDRERDRRDRKDREKEYDYEREKDRSRDKDRERRRRRDREGEDEERDHDDDKHRSSRRSRKDRDREDHTQDDREMRSKRPTEDDVVGKMMQKRAVSPPLNAPTGPSANTFSIKGAGRSKPTVMPPPQPPTGPRNFQPPKGPAADRDKDKHRRKSSTSSVPSAPSAPAELTAQDHYAAEREKNARERNSRDRVDRDQRDVLTKSLHSRIHSSRPSVSSKRSHDEVEEIQDAPRGPSKTEVKAPTGPASHRDKRRRSGAGGDNSIANLFTAGLRKNAGRSRRGGVRTEGDVEREMERVERERDRR